MKEYFASTKIKAGAATLWKLLTDAEGFNSWNSTVMSVKGKIAAGETITVQSTSSPKRSYPCRIAEFQPDQKMVWIGGIPLGLYRTERTYTIRSAGQGEVEFAMKESFSGIMADGIIKSQPDLQPFYDAFVADLKVMAEELDGVQRRELKATM